MVLKACVINAQISSNAKKGIFYIKESKYIIKNMCKDSNKVLVSQSKLIDNQCIFT